MAILLPAYLLALGFGVFEVGVLASATLLGSAAATLAVGAWGHRHHQNILLGAAALMAVTGFAFAAGSSILAAADRLRRHLESEFGRRRPFFPATRTCPFGGGGAGRGTHRPVRPLQPARRAVCSFGGLGGSVARAA